MEILLRQNNTFFLILENLKHKTNLTKEYLTTVFDRILK